MKQKAFEDAHVTVHVESMMICVFITVTNTSLNISEDGKTTSGLSLSLGIRNLQLFLER